MLRQRHYLHVVNKLVLAIELRIQEYSNGVYMILIRNRVVGFNIIWFRRIAFRFEFLALVPALHPSPGHIRTCSIAWNAKLQYCYTNGVDEIIQLKLLNTYGIKNSCVLFVRHGKWIDVLLFFFFFFLALLRKGNVGAENLTYEYYNTRTVLKYFFPLYACTFINVITMCKFKPSLAAARSAV